MTRILIIEDEPPAASRLENLLLKIDPAYEICGKPDSIEGAVQWLKNNPPPDLMMLDIQLADGLSFEIFRQVKIDSFVIFTTAYDEYAIKAFELNSIDYLLKPVNKEKLERSIAKFHRLRKEPPGFDIEEIIKAVEGKKSSRKKRFAISIGPKILSVETKNIAYFTSQDKNTFLGLFEGKEYPLEFSLDMLESILDPDVFFRINRQYIVNYAAIGKIAILSKSRLEIQVQGAKGPLLVSTAKTHHFREWIDK